MGKLFDLDSPLMQGLTKMADIIWLNLLTLLFFIPAGALLTFGISVSLPSFLVILMVYLALLLTGPAVTGMHYVLLKMVRNEESYITKSFFKSFKENFVQALILAAVVFLAAGLLGADLFLLATETMAGFPVVLRISILIVAIYLFMVSLWIFPVEARFVNTVPGTLKNAFLMSVLAFPRTIGMSAISLVPLVIYYFFGFRLMPLLIMFGISGPAFVCALLYNKVFKRFEPGEEEVTPDEAFTIAEVDESPAGDVASESIGETANDKEA
ncbi:MAG: DUF624 domain-containing protein [Lachnospiraceae bacterium]|nr:DUF624 domain-containing protein [Lachnospiraceae bacterium]